MLERFGHGNICPLDREGISKRPVNLVINCGLIEAAGVQFNPQGGNILGFIHQIMYTWRERNEAMSGDIEGMDQMSIKWENEPRLNLFGPLGLTTEKFMKVGIGHVHIMFVIHALRVVLVQGHGIIGVVNGIPFFIGPSAFYHRKVAN